MLSDIRSNDCHGKRYIVHVTVMKVNTSAGWSYLSCPICKKSLSKDENCFTYPKCNTIVPTPIKRYRLTVEVFDHTTSSTVIAFDKEAASLVNKSMIDMYNLENGANMVDKLFNQLIGAEAQFEFRPTNYDVINRGRMLTVSKISNTHFPYAPIDDNSVGQINTSNCHNSANDINGITSTQLTAESNTIEPKSKLKGKKKVNQDTLEFTDNIKTTKSSMGPRTRKRGGIVIRDADEIKRGNQKEYERNDQKKR